jgi:hypothetical protein
MRRPLPQIEAQGLRLVLPVLHTITRCSMWRTRITHMMQSVRVRGYALLLDKSSSSLK